MKHYVVNLSWQDSFIFRLPDDEPFNEEVEIAKLVYALQEGHQYWKDADFTAEIVEVKFSEPVVPLKLPKKHLKSVDTKKTDEDEDATD